MSPQLPRVTYRELERALRRDGWQTRREGSSHRIMGHPTKRGTLVIARHPTQLVPIGTLEAILAAAELDANQLRALL